MINNVVTRQSDDQNIFEVSAISKLITTANSPSDAFSRFGELLADNDHKLLLMTLCSADQKSEPINVYSNISISMKQLSSFTANKNGCPIVRKAISMRSAFEVLGSDFSQFSDHSSQSLLDEMFHLGHKEIAVIPILIENTMLIAVIGLNDKTFTGNTREYLMAVYGQFASALFVRFPDMLKYANSAYKADTETITYENFSSIEKEILLLKASGKTNKQISALFKLSVHTIQKITTAACNKLGANNEAHAACKAIKLGLFKISEIS